MDAYVMYMGDLSIMNVIRTQWNEENERVNKYFVLTIMPVILEGREIIYSHGVMGT